MSRYLIASLLCLTALAACSSDQHVARDQHVRMPSNVDFNDPAATTSPDDSNQ